MQILKRILKNNDGGVAILFGLSIIPLVVFAGVSVDYSRLNAVKTELQKAADASALHVVIFNKQGRSYDYRDVLGVNFKNRENVEINSSKGEWLVANQTYEVTVTASVKNYFGSFLIPNSQITVNAIATYPTFSQSVSIEGVNISPEASDYNELYAYCYNPVSKTRKGVYDPITQKHGDFAKIADNSPERVNLPPQNLNVVCDVGENVSLYMKNVRKARRDPALRLTGETWHHYTDTTYSTNGVPQYNTQYKYLIESKVCHLKKDCTSVSQGGVLPDDMPGGRMPEESVSKCNPGEYIYMGWEDRPPFTGAVSDRDYDDIRITMRCGGTVTSAGKVRLAR